MTIVFEESERLYRIQEILFYRKRRRDKIMKNIMTQMQILQFREKLTEDEKSNATIRTASQRSGCPVCAGNAGKNRRK